LDDVLGTTATALLGLTLRCARCHDHKFEPFSQSDYYSMLAVFEPLKRPRNERDELDRHVGSAAELTAYREALARPNAQIADLQKQIESLECSIRDRLFSAPAKVKTSSPGMKRTALPPEAIAAFKTEPAKRTARQQQLVKKHADQLANDLRKETTKE